MNADEIAVPLAHIPSGLFIITAQKEGKIDGYLGSWVQQASFSPLMVSLAIKPGRPCYDLIKEQSVFSINIVGEHEMSYLKHFWSGYDPAKNVFSEVRHEISQAGGVHLLDARSALDCKMIASSKPGDHEIIFAEVIEARIFNHEAQSKVHRRKSGLDY